MIAKHNWVAQLVSAVVLGALVCSGYCQTSDPSSDGERVLIVGEPHNIQLIRDISHLQPDGNIYTANLYRVTLKKVRVVIGSRSIPRSLTIEITAVHKEFIEMNKEIAVLWDVDKSGAGKAVFWQAPQTVVCFDSGLIKGTSVEQGFGFHRTDASDCALL